ncbi:hypothetical protein B0H19DRAFT_1327814 [Mycena capillaripes]|nr:hypothetical protein B0H19DRAFT_1327814 [Mycena capillaripes]
MARRCASDECIIIPGSTFSSGALSSPSWRALWPYGSGLLNKVASDGFGANGMGFWWMGRWSRQNYPGHLIPSTICKSSINVSLLRDIGVFQTFRFEAQLGSQLRLQLGIKLGTEIVRDSSRSQIVPNPQLGAPTSLNPSSLKMKTGPWWSMASKVRKIFTDNRVGGRLLVVIGACDRLPSWHHTVPRLNSKTVEIDSRELDPNLDRDFVKLGPSWRPSWGRVGPQIGMSETPYCHVHAKQSEPIPSRLEPPDWKRFWNLDTSKFVLNLFPHTQATIRVLLASIKTLAHIAKGSTPTTRLQRRTVSGAASPSRNSIMPRCEGIPALSGSCLNARNSVSTFGDDSRLRVPRVLSLRGAHGSYLHHRSKPGERQLD